MKSIVHINQHNIRANKKDGGSRPVSSVKRGRRNDYGHSVTIDGPSKIVYSPLKPLKCGAKVWLETLANVTLTTI